MSRASHARAASTHPLLASGKGAVDEGTSAVYSQWFTDMLREALEEYFRSDNDPYISTITAHRLFDCVFHASSNEGFFCTNGLDLNHTSDGKPVEFKVEYRKVHYAVCTEEKRQAASTISLWRAKGPNLRRRIKGESILIGETGFLGAIADQLATKRRAEGVDTLGAAQSRRFTRDLNPNPKTE